MFVIRVRARDLEMASSTARSSPSGGGNNNDNSTKFQKAKRKEPHPVRREFVEVGPNRHRCVHCEWSTVMNATRMIKHIIEVCSCPDELKQEMVALQQVGLICGGGILRMI